MVRKQVTLKKLESRFEEHRKRGQELRGVNPREAAQHLLQSADLAERIADLEQRDRVATQRRNLAENLRLAAREEMADQNGDIETVGMGEKNPTTAAEDDATDEGSEFLSDTDTVTDDEFEYFQGAPAMDFNDVGGMTELIEALRREVLIPLEYPEKAAEIGTGLNNGVLMSGPPGVGKTHLARCLAGELGYRFAEVDGTMLGSQYVNEGGENIDALFDEAEAAAPCVMFLDEIDDLAGQRNGGPRKTNSERGMVTKLLRCMERIQGTDVLVIGATNLIEDVDAAVRRSGRFNATYTVDPPDAEARRDIFSVHLAEVQTATSNLEYDRLVSLTDGFTGADIEAVVDDAGRSALFDAVHKDAPTQVTQAHLETAIEETTPTTETWSNQVDGNN
jgi:transitional endoplasmic reticulum ATPase